MTKNNTQIKIAVWFTTLFVVFIIFVLPGLMAVLVDIVPVVDQPGYSGVKKVSIYGERQLTQYFVSKNKNMVAIATSIKNPNLRNNEDITLNLYDTKDNLIRTSVLNGFNIGDGDFIKFVFDIVPNSKGQRYYFTISSPTTTAEEMIELFITDPTNEVVQYKYDDEQRPGGIPMVTFHKPQGSSEKVSAVYSNFFSKLRFLGFRK